MQVNAQFKETGAATFDMALSRCFPCRASAGAARRSANNNKPPPTIRPFIMQVTTDFTGAGFSN